MINAQSATLEQFRLTVPYLIQPHLRTFHTFKQMAYANTHYTSYEGQQRFEETVFGRYSSRSTAAYVVATGTKDEQRWVTHFSISLNTEAFGTKNTNLITYAQAHEIYEAWLDARNNHQQISNLSHHQLARQYQVLLAFQDRVFEQMISFYRKISPQEYREFLQAFDQIKKRGHLLR